MPKAIPSHPETLIYQGNNGEILLREDRTNENISKKKMIGLVLLLLK